MARALLASGAGKGTRIGLLAPDGALLLDHVLRRPAHRRARHADQHADDAARAGPHRPHERRPDPRRRAPVPAARLRGRTSRRRFPVWPTPGAARSGSRARRTCDPSGSTTPTGLAWARPVDELLARADCARRAGRRAARRRRAGGVARPTTPSSSTPRAARRRRRRSCTASGRSCTQAAGAGADLPHDERRPHDAAAAGVLAGRHRRRPPGAVHRQHAGVPAVARHRRRPRHDRAARRHLRRRVAHAGQAPGRGASSGASTSTGSGAWDGRHATSTASRSPGRSAPTCSACRRASRRTAASPSTGRMPDDKARRVGSSRERHRASGGRPRDRRGGAAGRGRRAPAPRRRSDDRLLQGRPRRGVHARRLLPDQGPRADRRRRLRVVRRSHRRHDQDELGQRVAARGRGGARTRCPRWSCRSSPGCPTPSSARWSPPRSSRLPAPSPTEDGLRAALRDRLSELQDPPPHRVHHRRRRPADGDRQTPPCRRGAARRIAARRSDVGRDPTARPTGDASHG